MSVASAGKRVAFVSSFMSEQIVWAAVLTMATAAFHGPGMGVFWRFAGLFIVTANIV